MSGMLVFIFHPFVISCFLFDAKAQDCDTDAQGSDTKAQTGATDAHDFATKACFRPGIL